MKVLNAFQDANSGRLVMPGEAYDEKSVEPEEAERLKEGNYIADGDGFKPGDGKLEDMSLTDLKATARAHGLDVEMIRSKDRLIAAINAGMVEPYKAPAGPKPTEEAVVNIGLRTGTNKVESRPVQQPEGEARTPADRAAQTRGGAQGSQPAGGSPAPRPGAPPQGAGPPTPRPAGLGSTKP